MYGMRRWYLLGCFYYCLCYWCCWLCHQYSYFCRCFNMYGLCRWYLHGFFSNGLCDMCSWKNNQHTCCCWSIDMYGLSAWLQFGRFDGCLRHLRSRLLRVEWSLHVANLCSRHRYGSGHGSDWLHRMQRRHVSRRCWFDKLHHGKLWLLRLGYGQHGANDLCARHLLDKWCMHHGFMCSRHWYGDDFWRHRLHTRKPRVLRFHRRHNVQCRLDGLQHANTVSRRHICQHIDCYRRLVVRGCFARLLRQRGDCSHGSDPVSTKHFFARLGNGLHVLWIHECAV